MEDTCWHHLTAQDALRLLDTSGSGLAHAEASARLERVGPNMLTEEAHVSPLWILLAQFKNFLVVLLVCATGLSLLLGHTLDAVVIFSIVILSALLGFYQEYRAERAMRALKAMAAPTASVIREGEPVEIRPPRSSPAMWLSSPRATGSLPTLGFSRRPTSAPRRPPSPGNRRPWRKIPRSSSTTTRASEIGATWCSPEPSSPTVGGRQS